MTTQPELVLFFLVIGLLVPAIIVYLGARLHLRAPPARTAAQTQSSATPFSAASVILRSMRWGIYGTIAAVVLFIIPGINLLCFGLLIIAGSVVSSLGVPDPFKEASACLLVELTFMFFFTAFRVAQIVCFHYLARLFSK